MIAIKMINRNETNFLTATKIINRNGTIETMYKPLLSIP